MNTASPRFSRTNTRFAAPWAIGALGVLAICDLAVAWSAWESWGASVYTLMFANLGFALIAVTAGLAAAGGMIVALLLMLGQRTRATGSQLLTLALPALGIVVGHAILYAAIRDYGIGKVVLQGDQIVAAIRAFEAERGESPLRLEDLLPAYLPAIPSPDAALCEEFFYSRGSSSWELGTSVGEWILDDSRLLYRSNQDYGDAGQCRSQYGDWRICG